VASSAPALVVLAAGLGTRYGGPKQLAPVGPDGEPLFVISARQAAAAGVEQVVVVTRTELAPGVEAAASAHGVAVELVLQDRFGPARAVPWGSAPAVAACAGVVDGPMVVANGDDHYGDPAIALAVDAARVIDDRTVAVVGFRLDATLSASGPVTRAVCRTDAAGRLIGLDERRGLRRDGPRIVDAEGRAHPPASWVSMNLFALPAGLPTVLGDSFRAFVDAHAEDDRAELLLPDELDRMCRDGVVDLRLIPTDARWAGLTHPGDAEVVRRVVRDAGQPPTRRL
jgi:hypothetical protein